MSDHFTPIRSFVEQYRASNCVRFHMPGHKGAPEQALSSYPANKLAFADVMSYDITEVEGADVLFSADGIIGKAEAHTAALFGVKASCCSAGGSTGCILAMTMIARSYGDRILAVRNVHLSFLNGCALVGLEPIWIEPDYDPAVGLCRPVTAEQIAAAMDQHPDIKTVYLTSPDYYGRTADIAAIADEVHARGGILLCDNAHGSHLRFLPVDRHPMTLGADICCDSAHKTLPVLTGGSWLHSNLPLEKTVLKRAMRLFASTSPSYLILQSLDNANEYLASFAREDFAKLEIRLAALKERITQMGITLLATDDPTKLTIDCQGFGMTDEVFGQLLREYHIEPEYLGGGKCVLMLSPFNRESDYETLLCALSACEIGSPIPYELYRAEPKKILPLRDAIFSPAEEIPLAQAIGRVAAETLITCPPAVPIVVAGEQITNAEKKLLQSSGIVSVNVIK